MSQKNPCVNTQTPNNVCYPEATRMARVGSHEYFLAHVPRGESVENGWEVRRHGLYKSVEPPLTLPYAIRCSNESGEVTFLQ